MAGDVKPDEDNCTDVYEAFACHHGHVHVVMTMKDGSKLPLIFADADDAYTFAQTILRAYDDAAGI